MIGSLRYAIDCIRLDIVYVVGMLNRFTTMLWREYCYTIDRIIKYLFNTKYYGLFYKKYHVVIETYSDVD